MRRIDRGNPAACGPFWTAALAVLAMAVAGCHGDRPEMVPVRGRVTLAGGPWPKAGVVNFAPDEPASGLPRRPGAGHFQPDGSFTVSTGDHPGLIPGRYRISVTCWKVEPADTRPGVSFTPERFASPRQSGLELTIQPGESGPVIWEHDLPRASGGE